MSAIMDRLTLPAKAISLGTTAPTMKDVARRAGVSTTTVSLVLGVKEERKRISAETQALVLKAADELHYSTNSHARALRSKVTNVIGLYAGYGYVNVQLPFFAEMIGGLQEGCDLYHKDLLLHSNYSNRSTSQIYHELRDGRIDGLIVHMMINDPLLEQLVSSRFPVIAVADALPGLSAVIVDYRAGAQLQAQHLFEKGHRHCLYISGDIASASIQERRLAFVKTATELNMQVQERSISLDPNVRPEILLKEWLSLDRKQRPTAVACWNDASAYSFLACCRQHGIRVPDDLALIGFDGSPTPYDDFWRLTTVRAPWPQVARTAVEHLNALIKGESIPTTTVLPVVLTSGNTT